MSDLVVPPKPRDCACHKCVEACKRTPGLFAPGEAEKAAELLGVPFSEFKKRLIKNFYQDEKLDPLVWQPRKVGDDPEMEIASLDWTNRPGRCVFLTAEDRCEIHAAKPHTCRISLLCEGNIREWPIVNALWQESGVKL